MPSTFRFRVLGIAAPVERFNIPLGISLIGNDPSCTLYINDREIAARHLEINYRDGKCYATNFIGANRTRHNNEPFPEHQPYELRPGDVITFGMHTLIFEEVPATTLQSLYQSLGYVPERPIPSGRVHDPTIPPGLQRQSMRLLHHLPELYQEEAFGANATDTQPLPDDVFPETFLSRFLGLFESVLLPLEGTIDNFDFYLDPRRIPDHFVGWMGKRWFDFEFDETWTASQQRAMLLDAPELFDRKGTQWCLERVLKIYTHHPAIIRVISVGKFQVEVRITQNNKETPGQPAEKKAWVKKLLDEFRPVFTTYDEPTWISV